MLQQSLCVLYTPTRFDTLVSSSGRLQSLLCYGTFVLQMAAADNTIYKIKMFHLKLT